MVHKFCQKGLNIVVDSFSGAIHVFDDAAFALLSFIDEHNINSVKYDEKMSISKQDFETALSDIKLLHKKGQLFSKNDYFSFKEKLGKAPVKALCLHIAHDCNLRCSYCFAQKGDFGGKRELMSFETAKKAIDLLARMSENRTNLEVDFFGGEPLMNFEVVKQTVQYARSIEKEKSKNFRFTITTNGVLLDDENTVFINENMQNIVLSIDGRKAVNDRYRLTENEKGSYDIILPKYQELVKKRGEKEYYVRGTYSADNLDFDKDVIDLYEKGFEQISVEPVVVKENVSYKIEEKHFSEIEKTYERLIDDMLSREKNSEKQYNFFHFMLDLEQGPCAIKRLRGCGSGNEYIAVTPKGEIYPCHQFVGNRAFLMGTVDTALNMSIKEEFASCNLLNKPKCLQCWAAFYCSGGCSANNYEFTENINVPYELSCSLLKIRLQAAIVLKVLQSIK